MKPYRDLPLLHDTGARHCWGLFGDGDELGALNKMTPATILSALHEVRHGKVFNLDLPLNEPRPGVGSRAPYTHNVKITHVGRDDSLDGFYPQYSSQWDGHRHIRLEPHGYFGGRSEADLDSTDVLGIDRVARTGIIGRALLVDVPTYMKETGRPFDPADRFVIDVDILSDALARHGLAPRVGDVLVVRTGWLNWYRELPDDERKAVSTDAARGLDATQPSAGLDASRQMAEWLWDGGIVAVAADNIAVEARPFDQTNVWLHARLLTLLGILIGELWDLDELAAACARDGVYSGLLVSAPLMLPRGVGSPANAYWVK